MAALKKMAPNDDSAPDKWISRISGRQWFYGKPQLWPPNDDRVASAKEATGAVRNRGDIQG